MHEPETSRRRRSNLPAITILVVLALAACFVAWKRAQAARRERCLGDLQLPHTYAISEETWSSEWPFYDVEVVTQIILSDGKFDDGDVRRLREAFPGVPIYHIAPERMRNHTFGPKDLVKLPED